MRAFIFNENRAIEYSLVISILKTFGVFIVFVTANWCVASFMDGKGRFKEILCATAYSLQPYIFCLLISIPLSHMVSYDEEILLNIIMCIGVIWTIIVLLGSLSAVHQFTPGKMILSLILTALAMGIILFLLMLAFSLVQMIIGLIIAIVREITGERIYKIIKFLPRNNNRTIISMKTGITIFNEHTKGTHSI